MDHSESQEERGIYGKCKRGASVAMWPLKLITGINQGTGNNWPCNKDQPGLRLNLRPAGV